jgi:transcriptional regulator, ArsR family
VIDQVLGAPTRIKIILALWRHGEMNFTELARRAKASQRVVEEQLKPLIQYGVVEVKTIGRVKLYRLSPDPTIRQLAEALALAEEALAAAEQQ